MNFKTIAFGNIALNRDEQKIYLMLNNEIPRLCASLPASVQTEAMMFMMDYAGMTIGDDPKYYEHFYAPAWSIIYWLQKSNKSKRTLDLDELEYAIRAQALALMLHSLDDHLHDGQIPSSHLLLLIRTRAWMEFNESLKKLSGKEKIMHPADRLIDDYYSAISLNEDNSLEIYLEIFGKQMSTWYIVPLLSAKIISDDEGFIEDLEKIFRAFMRAWRIIDDINDIQDDILSGLHTAVYLTLPEHEKNLWDNIKKDNMASINTIEDSVSLKHILQILNDEALIKNLVRRACIELDTAVNLSIQPGMAGLADEFSHMAKPLQLLLNEK